MSYVYSPRIDEELIPRIYRAAKAAKVPMTVWVSKALEKALPREPARDDQKPNVDAAKRSVLQPDRRETQP